LRNADLRQPACRGRPCPYIRYRRHSLVDHDTHKLLRHISTLYVTVGRKCLYI